MSGIYRSGRNQFSLAVVLFFSLISFNAVFLPTARAAVGDITTVAGNGTQGFSGDGGAAMTARLNNPYGVTVDSSGNLYIAVLGDHRIRRVDGATVSSRPWPVMARRVLAAMAGRPRRPA